MAIQPHDYIEARRTALALRREAWNELWRDADAVWLRTAQDAADRLVRSGQRWQAALARHRARRDARQMPCG